MDLIFVKIAFHLLTIFASQPLVSGGILYPQDSESREVKSLDGIWNFRAAPRLDPEVGFVNEWFAQPLSQTGLVEIMPVPSSYNDMTQSKSLRDHIGWVWYDRNFWAPTSWELNKRIFIRFGAVNYHAIVYLNGEKIAEHSGGALPFLAELASPPLTFTKVNRLTVAVNNTLNLDTIPPGRIVWQTGSGYPDGYFTQNINFDFFNYAGIHRSVFIYCTPKNYIDDINVIPSVDVDGTTGLVNYSVKYLLDPLKLEKNSKLQENLRVRATLEDKQGQVVASSIDSDSGILVVENGNLWWPFTMVPNDQDAGYLYTMTVTLLDNDDTLDIYRMKVGIRSVAWTNKNFLINGQSFYFRGFGRHEDFDIRGRGIDNVMIVKDHNLIKWTGANSYRTSHYPYAEEIMDLADQLGIVLIDETSAVGIDEYRPGLLENHKDQIRGLIERDKNRPSVVMWSVANEPQSQMPEADGYFKELIELTRSLDGAKRPITLVTFRDFDNDVTAKYMDILSINRYYGWYLDPGHTELITDSLKLDVQSWVNKFDRPLIISEYGADTISGLHMSPESVFTEEYQTEVMRQHFKAFDYLRTNSSLIGEHVWNFADFRTVQGISRVTGNRKGIFTRGREPKASAHLIRNRYHLLAAAYDNYPIPHDLI